MAAVVEGTAAAVARRKVAGDLTRLQRHQEGGQQAQEPQAHGWEAVQAGEVWDDATSRAQCCRGNCRKLAPPSPFSAN